MLPSELTSVFGAVAGIGAAALDILKYLRGTGLGFESWERQMQSAAAIIGAIIGALVCAILFNAARSTKLKVTAIAASAVILFFVLNVAAAVTSHYVTAESSLDLFRDILWKYDYLLFCSSLIVLVSCLPFFVTR
jgi:hypothetical protein